MLGAHVHDANVISHKVEKEGKSHGKNPPPKREMKKNTQYMDGWSNQDPLITTYIQYIHKRKMRRRIETR